MGVGSGIYDIDGKLSDSGRWQANAAGWVLHK